MRCGALLLFICLEILLFGCRKPKKGHYGIVFTSSTGAVTSYTCLIDKERGAYEVSHSETNGTLEIKGNNVSGRIGSDSQGLGSGSSVFYELNGKSTRTKITGTYTYSGHWWHAPYSSGQPFYSADSTDKGTFEIHRTDHL